MEGLSYNLSILIDLNNSNLIPKILELATKLVDSSKSQYEIITSICTIQNGTGGCYELQLNSNKFKTCVIVHRNDIINAFMGILNKKFPKGKMVSVIFTNNGRIFEKFDVYENKRHSIHIVTLKNEHIYYNDNFPSDLLNFEKICQFDLMGSIQTYCPSNIDQYITSFIFKDVIANIMEATILQDDIYNLIHNLQLEVNKNNLFDIFTTLAQSQDICEKKKTLISVAILRFFFKNKSIQDYSDFVENVEIKTLIRHPSKHFFLINLQNMITYAETYKLQFKMFLIQLYYPRNLDNLYTINSELTAYGIKKWMNKSNRPPIDENTFDLLEQDRCFITSERLPEIYSTNGMFGSSIYVSWPLRNQTKSIENCTVEVTENFLSWDGFLAINDNMLKEYPAREWNRFCNENYDRPMFSGFLPLIPNYFGVGYLQCSAAIWINENFAIPSKSGTQILPMLALRDIYTRPTFTTWCKKMIELITPICLLVLPDMKIWNDPREDDSIIFCRLEKITNLSIFVLRCIIANILTTKLLDMVFIINADRVMDLSLSHLDLVVDAMTFRYAQKAVEYTLLKWKEGVIMIEPPAPRHICAAFYDTVYSAELNYAMAWTKSDIDMILKRSGNKPYTKLTKCSRMEKYFYFKYNLHFILGCDSLSNQILKDKIPEHISLAEDLWLLFCDSKCILTSAAIVYQLTEKVCATFRKRMRSSNNYHIPLYGLKSGLMDVGYCIRIKSKNNVISFMEIPAHHSRHNLNLSKFDY